ncbi:unnamed protein product [Oppiella nova]|uniref:Uncharacterized protein n=1 Tax=Oppiella nova TaxID=334625 RepID=A0A7R9MAI4_9ACAR|nr:unnamed protein product [Oppiella nova]CAG2173722.1 unnamed protein product [Oppiella nova]
MNQEGPRLRFKQNINEYIKDVELSDQLVALLRTHPSSDQLDDILKQKELEVKKRQIFLQFTHERYDCDLLADMLQKSGQDRAADKLRQYNKSEEPWSYTNDIKLDVVNAKTLRSGHSTYFRMDSKPRGRAVIFCTIPELRNETLRWQSLLEQIYFRVEIHQGLTCDGINTVLNAVVDDRNEGDSLIVMFLGHGHDEKVQGSGEAPGDEMSIKTIVDKFSEDKCPSLRNKPKIFLFNCCRNKWPQREVPAKYLANSKLLVVNLESIDTSWVNVNKRTYVIYACAEGVESWYDETGLTIFGQAFSHTLAQYAWYKHLTELIMMTHSRLESEFIGSKYELRPEIKMNSVDRQLYLNPGLP